jgi:hypothetical protein
MTALGSEEHSGAVADLDTALGDLHVAVGGFLAAADRTATRWTTPLAPGKWSPAQVVEHVTRIMDQSANVIAGSPSAFPNVPRLLRPLSRLIVFRRILKRGAFLSMRTASPFNPPAGPASPADGRLRVDAALTRFTRASRDRAAAGGQVPSTLFGPVTPAEFARFQELHVRHHLQQLSRTSP